MHTHGLYLLAMFVITVAGSSAFRKLLIHEQRHDIPAGFVKSAAAPANQMLRLRIALIQGDMDSLEKTLFDVSTPGSALYGQYLTKKEVEAFVAPSPKSVNLVRQWLAGNNITAQTISPAGDWLQFSISVSQANHLLDADFAVFTHSQTGATLTRTLSYSIPSVLVGHVDLIHPTVSFDSPHVDFPLMISPVSMIETSSEDTSELESGSIPSSCTSTVTPTCLQALYNIPTTHATTSTNTIGVSGFLQQFANQADLTKFLTAFRPDLSGNATTFTVQTLDNGTNPQNPSQAGSLANANIQYTVGVASGVPTTFISVGSAVQDGSLNGFLDIILTLLFEDNPPQVLTTSYGQNENTISPFLANQLCLAYMQLGTRGVSILFSSGSGGVAGTSQALCTTFLPTFPSGCPFITSVGSTTGIQEVSATFTSGGFSNIFPRPSYQNSSVSAYLAALGSTNAGLFNISGRAYPDVSAQGQGIQVVLSGRTVSVTGNAASTPIFASVIALLNDRLATAGRPPLGFLNPFLYLAGPAFNDVTTGSNPGCNTRGFPATAGWDPVTGLGTPNFANFLTLLGL